MMQLELQEVKGKNTGSLHQITPIKLASKTLKKLKERNNLDTKLIDDVVRLRSSCK